MRVKSISHAGLTVSDFGRALRFYHRHFGFLLVSESFLGPEETARLFPLYRVEGARVRLGFLRAPGGGVLELFSFEPAIPGPRHPTWNAPGFTHLALDVSGLPRWKARLEAEGVEFLAGPERTEGTDWAFLRDPDGNLVELIDLKAKRPALRLLGGLVGRALRAGRFAGLYEGGGGPAGRGAAASRAGAAAEGAAR